MRLLGRFGHGLRLTILVSSLVLAAPQAVTAASPPAGSPPPFPDRGGDGAELARNSWIVSLADRVDPSDAAPGLARAAGGRAALVYEHALNGFQLKGSAQAAEALRHDPRVLSVVADRPVTLAETAPFGVQRIDAFIVGGGDAYAANFRGKGARIAVIDTGIDLDHPDLAASIDAASGYNCVSPSLAPDDGHGHGTHVSGTAAAPLNGGDGVVGVAPEARLVPFKSFDDAGGSSEALVLCGLDHVVALNTDGDSGNDIDVVNMSWGDPGPVGACADNPLHTAICAADAAGAILVAGAGNDGQDGGTFVPAAFPEVIGVSAMADFDGNPGGQAGCAFVSSLFWYECDDTFAFFSNFGPSIDAIAPGVNVYSTWAAGGYQTIDGTSMASPHVAGIAALMAAAHPGLTPAEARAAVQASGECPNGRWADADGKPGCTGQGSWPDDPDGSPEVLPNALRAAQAVATAVQPPPSPTPTPGPTPTVTPSPLPTATPLPTPTPSPSPSPAPTGSPSVPAAPQALTAKTKGTTSEVILRWSAPSTNGGSAITRYVVYRQVGGTGAFAPLGETPNGTTTAFTDRSVARGTAYAYYVTAWNASGESAPSNTASVRLK